VDDDDGGGQRALAVFDGPLRVEAV